MILSTSRIAQAQTFTVDDNDEWILRLRKHLINRFKSPPFQVYGIPRVEEASTFDARIGFGARGCSNFMIRIYLKTGNQAALDMTGSC